jgi:acetyl-CoA carboxylase carboxyltransferase component
MVGKDSEESGIIRRGAKLVNAVSNSVVPKITMIIGNSYGAGNYALCGKAYDPRFIFAWPNARCAVMGGDQAADTLFTLQKRAAERHGVSLDDAELERLHNEVRGNYQAQADIRYAAARGWVDAIVSPHATRATLIIALELACREAPKSRFSTGVFQV